MSGGGDGAFDAGDVFRIGMVLHGWRPIFWLRAVYTSVGAVWLTRMVGGAAAPVRVRHCAVARTASDAE
jgi:hypothetical protein